MIGRTSKRIRAGRASRSNAAPGFAILAAAVLAFAAPTGTAHGQASSQAWSLPDIDAVPVDGHGRQVRYGRELVARTYAHIGPQAPDPTKRYAGNNLACQNCHLHAGTKRFGLPLWGLTSDYPSYNSRSGQTITLAERVDGCMARSMNGRPMPADGPEMQAVLAYLGFLSTGIAPGQHLAGHGSGTMPELDRAADPGRGKDVYGRVCAVCHGAEGRGIRWSLPTTNLGYMVPPLWGPDSFNNGAGMARLTTAANFIHSNMPNGTEYLSPRLSPEDAWDVAAYVLAQPRPTMAGRDKDFSADLLDKPFDAPYGPYADGFSETQHRLGPFGPIRAKLRELREAAGGGKAP